VNVVNVVPMLTPPPERPRNEAHVSVLPAEVLLYLEAGPGSVIVDATLGAGGHSELVLSETRATVIAIDRDPLALELARERLARFEGRVRFVRGSFGELAAHLEASGVGRVDGLLADLGVSSMQLDDPARGMSFRGEGALDMRMDPASGETALELIDRLGDDGLADVIYKLGEERRSRRIARCIKRAREAGELETTLDLRRAVIRAVGPSRIGGVDPATRTFQALRIAVNRELEELEALLAAAKAVVAPGGRVAIISFHSLEDRIVKRAFRERDAWVPLTKKPLVPTEREQLENPRSRSAKLRVARRLGGDETPPPSSTESLDPHEHEHEEHDAEGHEEPSS
jgi:16S rRNA (cytosine1402-N4)-methyltransferase